MNAASDPSTERKRLLERDAEWVAVAFGGRDVDRILSYWTDDAVVFPPGLPPLIGKAALREYVENSLRIPGFKISWQSTDVKFSPDLKLAYMFSENSRHYERTRRQTGHDQRPSRDYLAARTERRVALRRRYLERSTAKVKAG